MSRPAKQRAAQRAVPTRRTLGRQGCRPNRQAGSLPYVASQAHGPDGLPILGLEAFHDPELNGLPRNEQEQIHSGCSAKFCATFGRFSLCKESRDPARVIQTFRCVVWSRLRSQKKKTRKHMKIKHNLFMLSVFRWTSLTSV